jgi:osmotically-inducible protein OsmY
MTQSRRYGFGVLALAASGALLAYNAGAQEPQAGRKVGEKIDEAAAAVRRGVDRASDSVRAEFHKVKASVNAMGVAGRVYGRLRWDKGLEAAKIDVDADRDGTVTLSGTVADAVARGKAVRLAAETVGVVRVADELRIPVPPPKP